MPDRLPAAALDQLEGRIDGWLAALAADNPAILSIERGEPDERRWYVRMAGEEKPVFAIWLTLRERTLHYETYVAPAPPKREAEVYELLLRRNAKLYGASFQIGAEDAIYLAGLVPSDGLDAAAIDRVLGSLYDYVEASFALIVSLCF